MGRFEQAFLPGAQGHAPLNEATQHADHVDMPRRLGADEAVLVKLQADIAPVIGIVQNGAFADFQAVMAAEAGGDQAHGVQHVHGQGAMIFRRDAGHVLCGDDRLFHGNGLNGKRVEIAGGEIAALGTVAGGPDIGQGGFHAGVDDDAGALIDAGAVHALDVGGDTGGNDQQIGVQGLAVGGEDLKAPVRFADAFDAGGGHNAHAMILAPGLEHVAGGLVQHAGDHAVLDLHHREVDTAAHQRLEDDGADEARAHEHDVGSFLRKGLNGAGIVQRPAMAHARA